MSASVRNVNADAAGWLAARERSWRTAFWVAWTVVVLAKIVLAASLPPFGDEAWYWQESRALAWSYSDLPPATAWLIHVGEALFGHGVLGMRAMFIAIGALLPLIIVRMGRRMFGDAEGWCAGILMLAMPLTATLGIFALPDAPLTLASTLALDAFERAARTRRLHHWTWLGACIALAWLCHYRAAMLMFAGVAFLLLTPRGRMLWRDRGLWLALAVALLGVVPIVVFNASHAWIALGFQLVQRNPWAFHADALVQPLEQALVCTPLFYGLLLWAAWRALQRRREGAPYDLLAWCAVVPLVAYFVLGCFADDTRFRLHWPLPGYLPLLLMLPVLLPELPWTRARRPVLTMTFATLVAGGLLTFAYLAIAALPGKAMVLAQFKAFPEHFVGWDAAAARTRELLAEPRFADVALAADNFMLAAELDFALGGSRPVYSLDHPLNIKHGRAPQLQLWGRDEAGLRVSGASHVLLVAEPTARRERDRAEWMQSLCVRLDGLTSVAALDLYDGRKRYRWFDGRVAAGSPETANPSDCAPARL